MSAAPEGVILQPTNLAAWGDKQRSAGRTIAFTNGCFDLIHSGHLASLNQAAALADVLVVALNSDRSVTQIKGAGRPILPATERASLIASLRPVSAVTIFAEATPLASILQIRPDILVKGAEYTLDEIVGGHEITAWGGHVERVPMVPGRSTSQIIAMIKNLPSP